MQSFLFDFFQGTACRSAVRGGRSFIVAFRCESVCFAFFRGAKDDASFPLDPYAVGTRLAFRRRGGQTPSAIARAPKVSFTDNFAGNKRPLYFSFSTFSMTSGRSDRMLSTPMSMASRNSSSVFSV